MIKTESVTDECGAAFPWIILVIIKLGDPHAVFNRTPCYIVMYDTEFYTFSKWDYKVRVQAFIFLERTYHRNISKRPIISGQNKYFELPEERIF